MKFCQDHWTKLRAAIIARGLGDLISSDGPQLIARTLEELQGEDASLKTFDPLMAAHNLIVGNSTQALQRIGVSPLLLFKVDDDHPNGWCPICFLNFCSLEHDRLCTDADCPKAKGLQFDDWIEKAANGVQEYAATLPKDRGGEERN